MVRFHRELCPSSKWSFQTTLTLICTVFALMMNMRIFTWFILPCLNFVWTYWHYELSFYSQVWNSSSLTNNSSFNITHHPLLHLTQLLSLSVTFQRCYLHFLLVASACSLDFAVTNQNSALSSTLVSFGPLSQPWLVPSILHPLPVLPCSCPTLEENLMTFSTTKIVPSSFSPLFLAKQIYYLSFIRSNLRNPQNLSFIFDMLLRPPMLSTPSTLFSQLCLIFLKHKIKTIHSELTIALTSPLHPCFLLPVSLTEVAMLLSLSKPSTCPHDYIISRLLLPAVIPHNQLLSLLRLLSFCLQTCHNLPCSQTT